MYFLVIFVISALIFGNDVFSKPQAGPTQQVNTTTPNAVKAFQDALKNGVDLPANLQNSLQNLQNTTKNGADLPNLSQILEGASNTDNDGGTQANPVAQSNPSVPNTPKVATNLLDQTSKALAQNPSKTPSNAIPSALPSALPSSPQNLLPSVNQASFNSNLGRGTQNIPSPTSSTPNLQQGRQQLAQNFPQFLSTQSPLLNPQSLSSLLPNLQSNLDQLPRLPSLNQGRGVLQNLTQNGQRLVQNVPQQILPNFFPNQRRNPLENLTQVGQGIPQFFQNSFPNPSAFPSVNFPQNQTQGAQDFTSNFPQFFSNSLPSFNSDFGRPSPFQNLSSTLLPTSNNSLNNFDLEEESGSEISEQRRGQMGNGKVNSWPLVDKNFQQNLPGGLLSNLNQFTGNQIQTTRDALRNTAQNVLGSLKLRNQERRLLRQQQGLGGLLGGNGVLGRGGGSESGNNPASGTTNTNGFAGGIVGQNSPGLLGGLVGFGRR